MKGRFAWLLILAVLAAPSALSAQWARTYGGKSHDSAACIQPAPGGGFIVVGTTESYGKMNKNIWIFKLSASGLVLWQKYLTGDPIAIEKARNLGLYVQNTRDKQFIVTGELAQGVRAGNMDLLALKLDAHGVSRWVTGVADPDWNYHSFENGQAVTQTSDGGYLFTGVREIRFNPPTDPGMPPDRAPLKKQLFVFKTDSLGNGKWGGHFGRGTDATGRSILETPDGGFIVAGRTNTAASTYSDAYVLKFGSSRGNLQWSCTYGGADADEAHEIHRTADGNFIVAGPTRSFGAGDFDVWLLKINGQGKILWQKTYGGPEADYAHSVQALPDGGCIIAGTTASFGGGDFDCWVLRLKANGNILWQKAYGGTKYDGAFSVRPLKAGGFVVAGRTRSYGAGGDDAMVMKLAADGRIDPSCGVFVTETSATVLKGEAVSDWTAGSGGCASFQDWWPVTWSRLKDTSGANTVICKK